MEKAFNKLEKQAASKLNKEVIGLLDEIKKQEGGLATNFAKLGVLLTQVRGKKYWLLWGYKSFGEYIESIREQVDKGRTQLYGCISIAEKLLPVVGEESLSQMGISKALELKKAMQLTGKKPSAELVIKAKDADVKVAELKASIANEYHIKDSSEKGNWWDFGGFYLTNDEKQEITDAMNVARKTDPVIYQELPEHMQRKEILLRFAREYLSTYGALAAKGEA